MGSKRRLAECLATEVGARCTALPASPITATVAEPPTGVPVNTSGPLDTPEKINAMRAAMAAAMPAWVPPAAYGVTLVPAASLGTTSVHFPVVNVGVHGFPALAVGEVTGRRSETATYEVSAQALARAVDIVAPAEAATMYQHPNLTSWRRLLNELERTPGGRIFAVFIASLDDPVSSPYDEALRQQIADGDQSALHR